MASDNKKDDDEQHEERGSTGGADFDRGSYGYGGGARGGTDFAWRDNADRAESENENNR